MRMLGLLCCLLLLQFVASAQSYQAGSLRGLDSFSILVEDLGPEAGAINLTKEDLRRDVELKLRIAGVTIAESALSNPRIYVNLSVLKIDELYRSYMYCLRIEVKQRALLHANEENQTVTAWDQGFLGLGPYDELNTHIRTQLKDGVDRLLNDYLSVNPRSR